MRKWLELRPSVRRMLGKPGDDCVDEVEKRGGRFRSQVENTSRAEIEVRSLGQLEVKRLEAREDIPHRPYPREDELLGRAEWREQRDVRRHSLRAARRVLSSPASDHRLGRVDGNDDRRFPDVADAIRPTAVVAAMAQAGFREFETRTGPIRPSPAPEAGG